MKNLNQFTIKLRQLLWFQIIFLVGGGKKAGERFAYKELSVPLLTRGGLKEENSINHILPQKGGSTPEINRTRNNVNK